MSGDSSHNLESIREVAQLGVAISQNIRQVIVGNDEAIELALIAVFARGHALIEDVPGTGKTTLCQALADSVDCQFGRIQFTPDLLPSDLIGVNVFRPTDATFEFRPGPVFTQVLLADEINRASPRTQSALLQAMQERQVSIDGETRALPAPFFVFATQNPVELEGTFPLPEAQLDRFLMRIALGYPARDDEKLLLDRFRTAHTPPTLKPVTNASDIAAALDVVLTVRLSAHVEDYLLDVIGKTRAHPNVRLGASPRATLLLQRAAQARAALDGRDYVLPDDVKALVIPVLSHRMILETEAQIRGVDAAQLLGEILSETDVPLGDQNDAGD